MNRFQTAETRERLASTVCYTLPRFLSLAVSTSLPYLQVELGAIHTIVSSVLQQTSQIHMDVGDAQVRAQSILILRFGLGDRSVCARAC